MSAIQAERTQRLKAALAEAGFDALVVYGNAWQCDYLRYATDFPVVEGDAIAIVLADGETEIFVDNPGEAARAAALCPGAAVRWGEDITDLAAGRLDGMGNRKISTAPATLMPYGMTQATALKEGKDATALIDALLLKKAPIEIDAVRRAVAIAEDGYRAFMDAVRVGRAEYEVIADVEAYYRSRGISENFMIMGSGGQEVRGMHPPGERRLQEGDLVTTELTPCVDGYYAQVCRTLVLGEPSDAQRRAFDVWIEAVEAGHAVLRAGVTAAEVARAENDVFRAHGLGAYCTSEYTRVRGHGVGLFVDNRPHILEDVDIALPEGATLIVHPNTYHPEVGYMVLGDVSLVTADGHECLGTLPRELLSVPA
jgi:Xaa-Pro aminopeptidase